MSSGEQAELQPRTPSFAMLRTLGGVAMLAGFLVVMVYQWTKPIIDENKRIAIEKAVFRVVPNAVSRTDYRLGPAGLFKVEEGASDEGETIYAAYDGQGKLRGVALEAAATGYQDVIRILYGYDPGCECVTGIKVLKMAETPGLGDKIAFDPEFLKNFDALDARLNADGTALELRPMDGFDFGQQAVAVSYQVMEHFWKRDPAEITRFSRDASLPSHGASLVGLYTMKDKRVSWFSLGQDEAANEEPHLDRGQEPRHHALLLEGVLEGEAVYHRGEHPHVVGRGALYPRARAGHAAEYVASSDDYGDLYF